MPIYVGNYGHNLGRTGAKRGLVGFAYSGTEFPQDENGISLASYATQAIRLTIYVSQDTSFPAGTSTTIDGSFSVVFKTSGGDPIGTLAGTFNYSGSGDEVTGTNQFRYNTTSTTGPIVEDSGGTDQYANGRAILSNNGANCGGRRGATGRKIAAGQITDQFNFITPFYSALLPSGATAEGTLTVNCQNYVNQDGSSYIFLSTAARPDAAIAIQSDGTVTINKLLATNPQTNRWRGSADSGQFYAGPTYTAKAWDCYWFDGIWMHATSPLGGDTASFSPVFTDDGTKNVFVRITNQDGFTGWLVISINIEGKESIDAILLPDGAWLMAAKSGSDVTVTRIEKDKNSGALISTLANQSGPSLTLKKSGDIAICTRDATSKNFSRKISINGGESWQ